MFKKLWNDETGAVLSLELVLLSSIVVIGAMTGLSSLRDAVVTEVADLGAAVGRMDQSYSVSAITGYQSFTAGSNFGDIEDPGDVPNAAPHQRCIVICSMAFAGESEKGGGGRGFDNPSTANPELNSNSPMRR